MPNGEPVIAIIMLKVDTKDVDRIADEIAANQSVEEVFLVTGDTDMVLKAKFENYRQIKEFVVSWLSAIPGVRETKTQIVVTTYKERGVRKGGSE
jgi:DNA-binding Lrp family transcriptional regulator